MTLKYVVNVTFLACLVGISLGELGKDNMFTCQRSCKKCTEHAIGSLTGIQWYFKDCSDYCKAMNYTTYKCREKRMCVCGKPKAPDKSQSHRLMPNVEAFVAVLFAGLITTSWCF